MKSTHHTSNIPLNVREYSIVKLTKNQPINQRAIPSHLEKEEVMKGWKEGRDHVEDRGVDGTTILEWILEKQGRKMSTGCI
jgi:hypothetical protein